MIIGGGSRSNWRWFSRHLMNGVDNEAVRIAEIRGLPAHTLVDAFEEMRLIASASPQCKNFFYHADINPREDEALSEQQWDRAIDLLEQNLGLDGQSRVVIEHDKNGRVHRHVLWSRIDPDTMRAIPDSNNYAIHMKTADELEKLFGHERTERGRGPEGPNPANYEVFRGKKSGIDPYAVKAELTELWRQSDSGHAFAAALDAHGYILARGDRRDFVVIDPAGDEHSLARRIGGAKTAEIRAFMADIDREALPSVDDARALARERAAANKEREDQQPETLAPAPPAPKHAPTVFDKLAEELIEAFADKHRHTADGPSPLLEPIQPPPAASLPEIPPTVLNPPQAGPTAFDAIAREMLTTAEDAAPAIVAGGEAVAAAEHPQEVAKELTAFERFAQSFKSALKEHGGELTIAESLDWLRRGIGQPVEQSPPTDQDSTPFERFATDTKRAMRENGGEPEPGFWQRSAAMIVAARDRALEWVRESAQSFAERIRQSRNNDRDNGLER
jgi:hypothetical protein